MPPAFVPFPCLRGLPFLCGRGPPHPAVVRRPGALAPAEDRRPVQGRRRLKHATKTLKALIEADQRRTGLVTYLGPSRYPGRTQRGA